MKASWFNHGLMLVIALLLAACGGDSSPEERKQVITQKGSDTMILLAQKWAEEFGKLHPNIEIQVTGGGSGTGISALINGTTDIANASRQMKESEQELVKEKRGTEVVEVPVARDGITIYLHSNNPVDSLTLEQLRKLYAGEITNWSEVGGNDEKVILYGRENSSGTYEFFKEHVLNKADFAAETQTLSGTAAVVDAVAKDVKGIGYGGHAYDKGSIKAVNLVTEENGAVAPTEENVRSGLYPLSRNLNFYLAQEPTGAMKEYIDWVLSPEGQKFAIEAGYYPLK